MRPTVMLFCPNVPRSLAFYTGLGFVQRRGQRTGGCAELEWPTAEGSGFVLNLHEANEPLPPTGRLNIGFEVESGLDELLDRLRPSGVYGELTVVDEAFGRIVHLQDPDGNALSIVQNEPELYV